MTATEMLRSSYLKELRHRNNNFIPQTVYISPGLFAAIKDEYKQQVPLGMDGNDPSIYNFWGATLVVVGNQSRWEIGEWRFRPAPVLQIPDDDVQDVDFD